MRTRLLAALLVPALLVGMTSPAAAGAVTSTAAPQALTARSATLPTRTAREEIRSLVKALGSGGASVAALRIDTAGAKPFTFGSARGMRVGSIVKLLILEELMYQRTHEHRWLTGWERGQATRMIEYSDNDAAYRLYRREGGRAALQAMATRLHLAHTSIDGVHFGLSTTGALDFVTIWSAILRGHDSVLDLHSREYGRFLTSRVVGWQRWGIGVTADAHTRFYNKNGWLSVDEDGGRWLVNTTGMAQVKGHLYLIVVLTQHGAGFDSGVTRVQKIAKIAVRAVE